MECIFCKIASGEIPCHMIYDSAEFMAFLDINPRTRGHALMIPKMHYPGISDMPDEKLFGLFRAVKHVSSAMPGVLGCTGFNFFINNGASAGQLVPHVHVHILPRYGSSEEPGVAIEAAFPARNELKADLDALACALRNK